MVPPMMPTHKNNSSQFPLIGNSWKRIRDKMYPISDIYKYGLDSYIERKITHLTQPHPKSNLLSLDEWMVLRGNPKSKLHNKLGHKWKNPSKSDIIILGNSMVHDLSNPREETWPYFLDNLSKESVYSAAVGGSSPLQYVLGLAELLSLDPKKVVFNFSSINNVFNGNASLRDSKTPFGESLREILGPANGRTGSPEVENRKNFIQQQGKIPLRDALMNAHLNSIADCEHVNINGIESFLLPHDTIHRLNLQDKGTYYGMKVAMSSLEIFKNLSDEFNFNGIVTYMPSREHVFWQLSEHNHSSFRDGYLYETISKMEISVRDIVRERCDKLNLDFQDLSRDFVEFAIRGFYKPSDIDVHPTLDGKMMIARKLSEALDSYGARKKIEQESVTQENETAQPRESSEMTIKESTVSAPHIQKTPSISHKDLTEATCAKNLVEIDSSSKIDNLTLQFAGAGAELRIGPNCKLAGKIFLSAGAKVTIGARTIIHGASFHVHEAGEVIVGDQCLFSHGISIRPSDAHRIFDLTSGERINLPAPIQIGNHVWIGEQVSIMKGALIPDGCVVGIGSIVTGKFDTPNCILEGAPARIVREKIRWDY